MPNDFASIGFDFASPQEFVEFAQRESERGYAQRTPVDGEYVRLGEEAGAQLWIQRSPAREVIGAHPHLSGPSRFRAVLNQVIPPSDRDTPLDGSILCTTTSDSHSVPFAADVPDFRMRAAELPPGSQVLLQMALLPREIQISRSIKEHESSPLGKLAADGAMIPTGLFRPGGTPIQPPQSQVLITGRVAAAQEMLNPVTQVRFFAVVVVTLGGEVDVPLSPTEYPIIPPVGSILAGAFSVSARVLEASPPVSAPDHRGHQRVSTRKPGLFKRLLGG